jgi:hypothetical protein
MKEASIMSIALLGIVAVHPTRFGIVETKRCENSSPVELLFIPVQMQCLEKTPDFDHDVSDNQG